MYKEELFEYGIVRESNDGVAVVSIQDSDKCKECTAKLYCKPGSSEGRSLTAKDPFGVHPGDKVRISINGRKILSASFFLYGIPLLLLISGILLGLAIFRENKELFSTLLSIVLILIYSFLFSFYSKRKKGKILSYPQIVFVNSDNS